jgi:hypothetical protein
MKRIVGLVLVLGIVFTLYGQSQTVPTFKLGTFQVQGRTFVGIVLRDSMVVEFSAASRAITPASNVVLPNDMKDLIARYNAGLRERIIQVVRSVNAQTGARPAYVYDLTAVKTMPPIMYPTTMLNVAVNYSEHGAEMAARDGNRATATPQGQRLARHEERSRHLGTQDERYAVESLHVPEVANCGDCARRIDSNSCRSYRNRF